MCLCRVATAAPDGRGVGDALLTLPQSFLSCLRARQSIILRWFQVTQPEIALEVQDVASALLGAACFQLEETPVYKCPLAFKEVCIGHQCLDSFPGDSWPPLPGGLLSAHGMIV